MLMKKSSLMKRADSEETIQSKPRSLPRKIQQQTIKRNYQGLVAIPNIKFPQCILHLYLSHNKITNLQGIEKFTGLQSINISYNELSRVQELRRIANPSQIRHLKMRMNPLPFGYQDYAISIFQGLKTFEDLKLTKQIKESHFVMREFVSKNLIEFLRRIERIGMFLDENQCSKENNMNLMNQQSKLDFQRKKDRELINYLLNNLKKLFIYPAQEELRKMTISKLLALSAEIIKSVEEASLPKNYSDEGYLQTNNRIFESLIESILLKFAARSDRTLIEGLRQIQESNKSLNTVQAFGRLGVFVEQNQPQKSARMAGGGLKSPWLIQHPGKYMQKMNRKLLKQHPENRMINWEEPEFDSLIPMQKTKWYKFSDLKKQESLDYAYEQIPLFIYCKEYLQVITEIIMEKVSEILQMQNFMNRQNCGERKSKNEINIVSLQKEPEEEIELDLSLSQAQSFGIHENQHREHIQSEYPVKELQTAWQEKIHPTKNIVLEDYQFSLSKYSLYQINLVFKVFCGFKARIKKRKNKKRSLN